MKPAEITALRKELRCTTHELADALGVTSKTVMAWEADSLFPTKRYIRQMEQLRKVGSVPRKRRGSTKKQQSPMQALADPSLWLLFRKLIAHLELREQVQKLADGYDEPPEE